PLQTRSFHPCRQGKFSSPRPCVASQYSHHTRITINLDVQRIVNLSFVINSSKHQPNGFFIVVVRMVSNLELNGAHTAFGQFATKLLVEAVFRMNSCTSYVDHDLRQLHARKCVLLSQLLKDFPNIWLI